MILGIVSDTHGHVEYARPAIRMLESFAVEAVIHCGDVGTSSVIELFRPWPTHFVWGNTDDRIASMERTIAQCGHTCHGRFGQLELAGRKIAFLHGDDSRRLRETIESGEFDLVCYGHTHQAEQHLEGPTTVLNPGALYRAPRHTLAVVQLPALIVTHVEV